MRHIAKKLALAAACLMVTLSPMGSANAGVGDLLVAPTRLILDGGRGAEVILKNIGTETATYRVSVEVRRMTEDGALEHIEQPTGDLLKAQNMIMFAPRKVVLPPNQPQSVRISARPPADLPDGEYRVHMLFRAIPEARPITRGPENGVGFRLTPIYGVSIPVIVRLGKVEMQAGLSNAILTQQEGQRGLSIDLNRAGNRSTYGVIRMLPAGGGKTIAELKGVAVYAELAKRTFFMPLDNAQLALARGPVTLQYYEVSDTGEKLMAETKTTIQ